jgi:hypothetical protein
METSKPKRARIIDDKAVRIVVCATCNMIVAEDYNRPIDIALVDLMIRSHVDPPGSEIFGYGCHDLVTAIVKKGGGMVGVDGVWMEKDFTD